MKNHDHDQNDHCSECGEDTSQDRWVVLWLKDPERKVGVQLGRQKRTREQVGRHAEEALLESDLLEDFCTGGHRIAIVHHGHCRMARGAKFCRCGPEVFPSHANAIAAGHTPPTSH